MAATDDSKAKLKPVKVGQTSIKIYQTARGEYQFRYYLAGKASRVTRVELSAIRAEAERIATSIENGRAQAGAITAADAQSLSHARRLLGPDDPPVHTIVEEWVRLKARTGGAPLDELAAMWQRTRPKGAAALDPEASRVESLQNAISPNPEQCGAALRQQAQRHKLSPRSDAVLRGLRTAAARGDCDG